MEGIWSAVVGQDHAVALLEAAAEAPVHAYLLVGPPGSGKRPAALAFAAALLCPERGCGTCRTCRLALAGQHPDVEVVQREGPAISAAQADRVVHLAARSPVEGTRKVLVLDEFHLLQPAVAPKLLKTVEEPPEGTVFVILADDVPPELVTIASRCVRVDFRPVPDALVVDTLVAEGVDRATATAAAAAATGDLDRARLLAADPQLVVRREAFQRLPHRLDGTGATVVKAVEELLGLIDAAGEPLRRRQAAEAADLDARAEQLGDRGSGRRAVAERHRRELRRHRTDELRAGLVALAAVYRDHLVAGTVPDPAGALAAVRAVHDAIAALDRNPNERLLLQALLLQLPRIPEVRHAPTEPR